MALSLGFGPPPANRQQSYAAIPLDRRRALEAQNAYINSLPGHAGMDKTLTGMSIATPAQAAADRERLANIDYNQVQNYYVDTGAVAPPGRTGTYDPNGPNARFSNAGNYWAQSGLLREKATPEQLADAERYYAGLPVQQNPYYGPARSKNTGTLWGPETFDGGAQTTPGAGTLGTTATGRASTGTLATTPAPGAPIPQPSTTGGGGTVDPRTAYALSHPNWNGVGTPWLEATDPNAGPYGVGTTAPAASPARPDPYGTNATTTAMGFGTLPAPVPPPQLGPAATVAAPPPITAPTVTPAQGGFSDFDAMQQAAFQSAYTPVARELTRQQGTADAQLNAQLAQAGVAESGTGINARQRQATEYSVRLAAAATDAANQAATTRYGLEYTQSMDNAKLRQEASMANAGFSYNAQAENARNLLTAGTANAQMQNQRDLAQADLYLRTIGLNAQSEQVARSQFLQLLGLQEADLARMDAYDLENLSLFYNTYLKQFAILVQAGQISYGKTDQSQNALDLSGTVGFGE